MARKFLTSIDLNQNELQNAILQPLATAPPNGALGQIYYNSADKKLFQHNGTNWVCVGITYEVELGSSSSNTVPLKLVGSDGSESMVNIKGAGGATLSASGDTLTITTANTNTTYTFSEEASATGYKVTITPSSGTAQTFTVPLATTDKAGLMSPDQFDKLAGIAAGANKTTVDSSMSASSTNPVQNKIVKAYIDNAIANLPADQFLDLTKTKYVDSFTWSSTTYPGSTNPSLNGKPVLVLALTDGTTTTYSFVSLNDLVDAYTGTSPINVSGGEISHANSGATAGSYGTSANKTIGLNTTVLTFDVPYVTVNSTGHVTGISNKTITIEEASLLTGPERLKISGLPQIAAVTDTIPANTTSYSIEFDVCFGIYSATAMDAVTFEPVVLDWVLTGEHTSQGLFGGMDFTLSSYANPIKIRILYATLYD